jgi:hypothetical protein
LNSRKSKKVEHEMMDKVPELKVGEVLRYDSEKIAYEQDTMNDEVIDYEQSIIDEMMDDE